MKTSVNTVTKKPVTRTSPPFFLDASGTGFDHNAREKHTRKRCMNIVLVEPEIPPNTGNVARLCATTRTTLHLIEPFGFKLDDVQLKRAGMDYWQHVRWLRWENWALFADQLPKDARLWFIESNGPRLYAQASFQAEDYLVFGRETAGLPKKLLEENRDRWLRIPMFNPQARSLNLSNCVALVLFEALRQHGFKGELG
jgi:tRNA (cytidine/uridine-2'-O-)-methyltransferase